MQQVVMQPNKTGSMMTGTPTGSNTANKPANSYIVEIQAHMLGVITNHIC